MDSISITMEFKGVAIWVYFILSNYVGERVTTLTLANFTLDERSPVFYQHHPNQSTTTLYNQSVYSRTELANNNHTLRISTSGVDGQVFVSFYYAIYTHVNFEAGSSPSSQSGDHKPASTNTTTTSGISGIVGGIVGGTGVVVLAIFLIRRH
ncbi:hypothetical protein CPB83DRAFT_346767 [Crepidotus variabilis]|uniref:Uncharacterized protein n=1 Tax=Crepidotus variabilis TaxID=179855 RepID=A0A9P6EGD6_9AGAR|nr:hypothetical protein CPB83DRAFT_346767 [Crepidotus variabilis]